MKLCTYTSKAMSSRENELAKILKACIQWRKCDVVYAGDRGMPFGWCLERDGDWSRSVHRSFIFVTATGKERTTACEWICKVEPK